jgi:hypothetical protein
MKFKEGDLLRFNEERGMNPMYRYSLVIKVDKEYKMNHYFFNLNNINSWGLETAKQEYYLYSKGFRE